MTRRLLVTGAAGFIGANFVHYWHARHPGDRLVASMRSPTPATARTCAAGRRRHVPLRAWRHRRHGLVASLLREEAIDTIVHFAAESHVDRSIDGPDAFIDTNVVGTHSLLKAAREVWLGGKGAVAAPLPPCLDRRGLRLARAPTRRPSPKPPAYAPNSPYSASKAASDHLVRA